MPKSERLFNPPESSSDFNSHFAARIPLSETEPSKDHFNSSKSASNNNNSLDLLSLIQAIIMLTDTSKYSTNPGTISSQLPIAYMSSSASSSPPESPSSATNKAIESSSFSWCDFLLEHAFLPSNAQEQENGVNFSPTDVNKKEQQIAAAAEQQNYSSIKTIEDSSVSSGSFVEAMLARENEMSSDFHGLLEEPFYF